MQTTSRQKGTLHRRSGEKIHDVTYSLSVMGPADAFGHIAVVDDPHAVVRLMGDPASAASGSEHFLLITSNNVKVELFFRGSGGAFTCVSADEAAAALT